MGGRGRAHLSANTTLTRVHADVDVVFKRVLKAKVLRANEKRMARPAANSPPAMCRCDAVPSHVCSVFDVFGRRRLVGQRTENKAMCVDALKNTQ